MMLLNIAISHAQIAPRIAIQHNILAATGKEISKVYGTGLGIGLQGNIPVFKRKLSFQPEVSYTYFANDYTTSARDNLNIFKYGLCLAYNIKLTEKCFMSPAVGLFGTSGSDHISPRSGYSGSNINLLKFNGLAYDLGLQLINGDLIMQAGYIFSKVTAKVDDELIEELKKQNNINSSIYSLISVDEAKLSFDCFYVTVGYSIKLKK